MQAWWAITRWQIAESTGWTLEYIDGLNADELSQWLSIQDAKAKPTLSSR